MQKITTADVDRAAQALGVNSATVRAVMAVESNGSGFMEDGRVIVQYEPHIMYRRLKLKFGQPRADAELKAHPDLVALSAGSYQSKDKEDKDMQRAAVDIDRDCALESASWGLFQVMGYHWTTCGYPSLQAFLNDMYKSEGSQLDAFVRFVKANPAMGPALKSRDWATFAKNYNGAGYAANKYDTKLADAYKKFA